MRKKQILARVLGPTGTLAAMQRIRGRIFKQLPILNYHRILDCAHDQHFPFDNRLISASCADFDSQMNYVSRNFVPICFSMLSDFTVGRSKPPSRPIMITFDDGFDDFYFNAFPVLKKYGIRATFFIATDYIGSEHTFWFDYVAFSIKNCDSANFLVDSINYRAALPDHMPDRLKILDAVVEQLKSVPNQQRLDAIAEIEDRYGEKYDSSPKPIRDLSSACSWDQIVEMSNNGIEIGSHTRTHPILARLSVDELVDELENSKKEIEHRTGKNVNAIAYPNGRRSDFNSAIMSACENAGYEFAAAYHGGSNRIDRLQRYAINRLSPEPIGDPNMLPFALAFPNL